MPVNRASLQTAELGWLASLKRFGIKPGLERTRRVLEALDHPEQGLSFYHVAGTNGKGSVCAVLTQLLRRCGRTGTFTSSAYDNGFRDRIVVDGQQIADDDFLRLADKVRTAAERATSDDPLTEFEALTVMALLYFKAHRVDAVVWETGLGGRFDSTNVVTPVVTVITNISYDHVAVLGGTLAKIAGEKAGIIKPGIPVITAATDDAYIVIEQTAKRLHAPLWRCGVEFSGVRESMTRDGQWMSYRGHHMDESRVPVRLYGSHQCANTAVAIAAYEAARERGACRRLSSHELRDALSDVSWPGRFEIMSTRLGRPLVLDGAHNPEGARQLARCLREYGQLADVPDSGWTMVVGVLDDKDVRGMLTNVVPFASELILTCPSTPRAMQLDKLQQLVTDVAPHRRVILEANVDNAMCLARQLADAKSDGAVCCWGSLYTVYEARETILHRA